MRAGVSLPALMQLMGHAQIQTTMVYVQVTPLEVYQQSCESRASVCASLKNTVFIDRQPPEKPTYIFPKCHAMGV